MADLEGGMAAFSAMMKARIAEGATPDEALAYGRSLVVRFADAEVTRAADETAERLVLESGDFTGWEGIVSPGACEGCQANVGLHPLDSVMYRHPNCNCTKRFIVTPVTADTPEERFGATSSFELYQVNGQWSPLRQRLHNQIEAQLLDGHRPSGPRVVYLTGGGPASGKSLFANAGRVPPDSALVDPDAIKVMLPEYRQALAERRPWAASFTHDESSYLSKRISLEATRRNLNLSLDTVGDGSIDSLARKVAALRSEGTRVVADYATVPTEAAAQRALVRAEQTGRFVPSTYLREAHAAVSDVLPKAVERNLFDEVRLWDTEARPPTLIMQSIDGVTTIMDPAAWESFLAKAVQP